METHTPDPEKFDARDAVFAHPTLAESLNSLFAAPEPVSQDPSEKP